MKTKQLLLVEDHSAFRRSLAFMLDREEGLEVAAQAGSVAEGMESIRRTDVIDAAVLDLNLPDGSGFGLLSALREKKPGCSVLVLTVDPNPKNHAIALESGADEVIGKETALLNIIAAVRRLVDL